MDDSTLEAGPDLDARIAPLMGWADPLEIAEGRSLKSATNWRIVWRTKPPGTQFQTGIWNLHVTRAGTKIGHFGDAGPEVYEAPPYSRNPDSALLVWRRLNNAGVVVSITIDEVGRFTARVTILYGEGREQSFEMDAATFPLLLCQVALDPAVRARLEAPDGR